MSATIVHLRRHSIPCDASPRRGRGKILLERDPESLSDTDLLALMIGGGGLARERARSLLDRFHDTHGVERAAIKELTSVGGLGPVRAAAVKAGLTLGRRAACTERSRGKRISSSVDVHRRLSPMLRHLDREIFITVLLDARHRVIRDVRVAEGGLTACAVQPRDVLEPAVRECAAAVIFAHNHPSGDPSPSQEDLVLTRRLVVAAEALGIRVLDHIVVGDGRFVSFQERGLMNALK